MRIVIPLLLMCLGLPLLVSSGQPLFLGVGLVLLVWWWRPFWMLPLVWWLAWSWDALLLTSLGSRGGLLLVAWLALLWLPATPLVALAVLMVWLGLSVGLGWILLPAAGWAVVFWGIWLIGQWGIQRWHR